MAVGDVGGACIYANGERLESQPVCDADGNVIGYQFDDESLADWLGLADLAGGDRVDIVDVVESFGLEVDAFLLDEDGEVSFEGAVPEDSSLASYTDWLAGRASELSLVDTSSDSAREKSIAALASDPSVLAIYDSALAAGAINAAVVNPSTANVLKALNATVKALITAGLTIDFTLLENTAGQLGIKAVGSTTAGQILNTYLIKGTTALSTLAAVVGAVESPSIQSISAAMYQAVQAGIVFDSSFKLELAQALGIYDVADTSKAAVEAATSQVDNLMKGGGVALQVLAAADNPTPENVASAAVYVADYTGVVDLGGAVFPTAQAVAAAIGFIEEPTVVNGVETVLWTVAAVNAGNPIGWVAAAAATVVSVVDSIFGGGGKPIVLDMDGDGVELVSLDSSNAYYDMDGDQWVEHRGWVGADDAFLAYDANGDGKISGRDELSFVAYKEGARTDLEGLLAFDSNNDGKLTSADAQWQSLKVWRDADGDGVSDGGEVIGLTEAGISSITLSSDGVQQEIADNTVFGEGTFTRTDGSTGSFADVALTAEATVTHSRPGDGTYTGPLVLNLLGDRVSTLDRDEAGVAFDMDGDGDTETTGWIAPDEGFLVIDTDRDASIEDAAEMVGSFADLVAFDDNGDGKVDSSDAAWSDLKIWVDKNQDGHSQRDELYTLAQLGIASLNVTSTDISRYDNGNIIDATGSFTYTDGTEGQLASVQLVADTDENANTVYVDEEGVSTLELSSGQSVQFVTGGQTLDLGRTGIDIVVASGGGNVVNAGHTDSVVLMSDGGADTLIGGTGVEVTLIGDGNDTLIGGSGETTLVSHGAGNTLVGGTGSDTVSYSDAGGGVSVSLASGKAVQSDGVNDVLISIDNVQGSVFADAIYGDSRGNALDGGDGDDLISAGDGNDTLIGGNGADSLIGGNGVDTASYANATVGVTVDLSIGKGSGGEAEGDILVGIENVTGSAYVDILVGNDGANVLVGAAGDDHLDGGVGNDTLSGGTGVDSLNGGAGTDTVTYAGSAAAVTVNLAAGTASGGDAEGDVLTAIENLVGTAYGDTLKGDDLVNMLMGGDGDDTLDGGAGADTLIGGAGDDIYVVDATGDRIVEQGDGGTDTVDTSLTSYTLGADLDNLTYTGSANFVGTGNGQANVITGGSGDDTLVGGAGGDTLVGGSGIDTVSYASSTEAVTINMATGVSTGDAAGDVFKSIEIIQGSGYADTFTGDDSSNTFNGGAGNDIMIVSSGTDLLSGGAGLDTYLIKADTTGVTNIGNAGADLDIDLILFDSTLSFNDIDIKGYGANSLSISVVGSSGVVRIENWSTSASYRNDYIRFADSAGNITGYVLIGDFFSGTAVVASSGANYLLSGSATLIGSSGNDTLTATFRDLEHAGYYDGGSGNDTLSAHSLWGGVTISLDPNGHVASSAAVVLSDSGYVLGKIYNIENLVGTAYSDTLSGDDGNNILNGEEGNDYLYGGAGNDTLDGGTGADYLSGGTGDDVYYVDSTSDKVVEASGGGTDEVRTSISGQVLASYVENLIFVGSGNFYGIGNTLNNTITGGDGDDTFYGGGGADRLVGGAGSDTASYATGPTAVTINLSTGLGSGGDAAGDVLVSIENVIGSAYADTLIGNAGANTLDGGVGADTLIGGGGDDVYIVDSASDVVTEKSGEGTDEIRTSATSYTLGSNIETLVYTGTSSFIGTGNELANKLVGGNGNDTLQGGAGADTLDGGVGNDTASYASSAAAVRVNLVTGAASGGEAEGDALVAIENIVGSSYGDVLIGNSALNVLTGGGGDDTLDGGVGGDTLIGGAGNDVYLVDSASDVVTENAGEGIDEVRASVATYTLGANVENLVYTGTANFTGTGNATANLITGGAGNDTLVGGGGVDTLIGGDGGDTASYAASAAAVTVNLSTGAASGGDATGDVLSGIEAIVGSAYADVLVGDSGANTLNGGAGGDTLIGGGGDDVYVVDNVADVVIENADEGTDEIRTSLASFTLSANLEILTYTGTAAFVGTGNAGANRLIGGSGNDTLQGGAGADVLDGGAGIDTALYSVSSAGVTVNLVTGTACGGDAEGDVLTAIENVTGSAYDDVLVGNAAVNVLVGGAGSDTLDGGAGADTLTGGAGNDVYLVDNVSDMVTENAGEGTDEVRTSLASYTLAANMEKLTYIGAANFTGTGNTAANIVTGGAGDDTLIGGAGADTLIGGDGFDTASYTSSAAAVIINLATGIASGGDAAGDVLLGIESILGSSYADTFVGDVNANTFNGGNGTDTISYAASASAVSVNLTTGTAAGGDAEGDVLSAIEMVVGSAYGDTLASSTASTTLSGGAGDDVYVVGNASVVVVESTGGGSDEVQTSLTSLTLNSASIEKLTYTGTANFTGIGQTNDNIITGGVGSDTLIGGAGADTLVGGAGVDTASYSTASSAVSINLLTGVHTGDAAGDVFDGIEVILGSSYADTFVGTAGANTFDGGSGIDTISYAASTAAVNVSLVTGKGSGGDAEGDVLSAIEMVVGSAYGDTLASSTASTTLSGGAGDDVYVVGNASVVVVESTGGGSDEVQTSLTSLTLSSASIEKLTYTGTANFTGIGQTNDNIITVASAATR